MSQSIDDDSDDSDIVELDDDNAPFEDINEPKRSSANPIEERVVDESSMIGPTLFSQLMSALPKGGAVRFFGDNNQLPPVEEGTPPFIDVLERFPAVELLFNFRSDDAIVHNAMRILRSKIPERNDRFNIIYDDNPIKRLLETVEPEYKEATHQIIMPTRRGKYGTMRVNPSLQARFNARGPMLLLDRYDKTEAKLGIREGDKFLWIKNDYRLEMFNGEIGSVSGLDLEDGTVALSMQERHVLVPARVKMYSRWHNRVIDYDPRKQIELGYAITTHKSQGSEFDIIYCIMRGQAYLLNKRNFYTAVTRAKNKVIVIADRRAMGLSMSKHKGS
jgi:exodeoxyribonuclease V alpha subunit